MGFFSKTVDKMINEKVVRNIMSELYKEGYDCFVSEAQLRDAFAIKLKEMLPNCQ